MFYFFQDTFSSPLVRDTFSFLLGLVNLTFHPPQTNVSLMIFPGSASFYDDLFDCTGRREQHFFSDGPRTVIYDKLLFRMYTQPLMTRNVCLGRLRLVEEERGGGGGKGIVPLKCFLCENQ